MWKEVNNKATEKTPQNITAPQNSESAQQSTTSVPATGKATGNIAMYREAVEEFSTNASEFLKCIPTLTKTRDAYQRAMSISAELRKLLDTGDEKLGKMMSQIEEAINVQLATPPDKKRPGVSNPELIRSGTSTPPDVLSMLANDFEKRFKEG